MSPVQATKNAVATLTEQIRWRDLVVSVLSNFGAMAALIMLLWMLFSGAALNKVTEVLKEELGTDEILATAERNSAKVDALTSKVDGYVAEMRERLPLEVAYIDEHLSRVEDGCRQFMECTAVYFVKRYTQWLHCKAPVVLNHQIMDAEGVLHPAIPGANNRAQRLGSSLARVIIKFIPDDQTPPGISFFSMVLQYDCGDQFIEQATHPIKFTLSPARQKP